MASPLPSSTLRLEDLLVKWQEMESDWHIAASSSTESMVVDDAVSLPSVRSINTAETNNNPHRHAIVRQTHRLQQLLTQHKVYSARWKWIPPPFHTHWTAAERASYLDVHARRITHATVAQAAPLVRTAVLENLCVVRDNDPSYPRFCVVVWPCTVALSVPKIVLALQSLRGSSRQKVATKHFDLCYALPRDAQRLTHSLTASQCACPLLPSAQNHGTPVILCKTVVPLRYFWMDTGHLSAKVGVTVADFVRVVQPIVASIEREAAVDDNNNVLSDPTTPGTTLDVIPENLRRRDVDVEALRLETLEQGLPKIMDAATNPASTAFRPRRRSVPLHVLHKNTVASQQRRLRQQHQEVQKEREENAKRELCALQQRKPPVPRFLSPTSRLLQPTQSSAAHFRKDESQTPTPRRRKPALPPEARGVVRKNNANTWSSAAQSRRQPRGYERSTVASQRGRSVPPPNRSSGSGTNTNSRLPRSTKRRTRGSSAPLPTTRSLLAAPLHTIPDTEPRSEDEADELIGSVENEEDFLHLDDDDAMMLDDMLSDDAADGEIIFGDDNDEEADKSPKKEQTFESLMQNLSAPPSPKKEMQTQVVSELYKKLTAIPVPSQAEMQALFEQVDRQGNGRLRLRHIETAIVQRKFDLPPTVVLRAFQTADTDADGMISRDEFFQFMRCITYFENLMQLFVEMDVDSDRRLDKEEFLKAANVLEVSDPEAVFGEMNGHRSGYVVFDQFCLWMSEKRALENVGAWASSSSGEAASKPAAPRNLDLASLDTTLAELEHELQMTQEQRLEKQRLADEKEAKAVAEAEAKHLEEKRLAAETARRLEEERLAVEKAEAEALQREAERVAAEEARRIEQQRLAAEKAAAEAEARRLEEERLAAEARRIEQERLEAEKAAVEAEALRVEEERLAAEARRAEEKRLLAEATAEAEARRLEEERIAAEKAALETAAAEAEARRLEEERVAAEKTAAEAEARRLEEERVAAEAELKRLEEERIHAEKAAAEEEETKRMEEELVAVEEEIKRLEEESIAAEMAASEEAEAEQSEEEQRHAADAKARHLEEEHIAAAAAETNAKLLEGERVVASERAAAETEYERLEKSPIADEAAQAEEETARQAAEKNSGEGTEEDSRTLEAGENAEKVTEEIATPRKDGEPYSANGELLNIAETESPTQDLGSPSKETSVEAGLSQPWQVPENETPFKEGKRTDTTVDTEVSFFSADGMSPIKHGEESGVQSPVASSAATSGVVTEETVVSSGRATPVMSNQTEETKTVPARVPNEESDREKLKAIMDRRRKMADEVAVESDNTPKARVHQSTLDAEVQSKLERRRSLSDDGAILTGSMARRGSTKGTALDDEVQSKLERRRCLSDDGVDLTEAVERRATTRREKLRSVQMSNDLQAIMARRRQAADAESNDA